LSNREPVQVFELTVILFLVLLNGLFALSELAVVSARRSRLMALADQGRRGARRALLLADDPGRFLSTVQIGITLIGIVAGAFSGATLGSELTDWLRARGFPYGAAEPLGFGAVVALVTYFSLVVGELVPKRLALQNAEVIACAVAPAMMWMARVAAPAVGVLDASTRALFKLTGQRTGSASAVTEEEIKSLIAEAETAGVLEADERQMISGVLRLGDRPVKGVMTPRTDVDWLNLAADEAAIRQTLIRTPHSRLPAGEGSIDAMIGVVQTRDVLAAVLSGRPLEVGSLVRKAPVVPDTLDALDVLTHLREAEVPMALVHDEYGHFEGVVTRADILEAIAGAFRADTGPLEAKAVRRDDGSWLLSGWMPADEMADVLGIALPARRDYQTVAGFVLAHLQRLPVVGESCFALGWRFEVVDIDGRRIDKVLASRSPVISRVRA
jgi:putative hemolysin